jgi:hypothetical protein
MFRLQSEAQKNEAGVRDIIDALQAHKVTPFGQDFEGDSDDELAVCASSADVVLDARPHRFH